MARLLLLATLLAPTAATAQAPTRVVIVGDSHVEHLGPLLEDVAERAGLAPLGSFAHRGWSTARFVRDDRLQEEITVRGHPDVVIVALGGNDRPADFESYRRQLAWVVAEARSSGAQRVVWLGPARTDRRRGDHARQVGVRHARNAAWQQRILPALGVSWIDSAPVTEHDHAQDGVHFTARGYRGWARAVFDLGRLGEDTRRPTTMRTTPPPIIRRLGYALATPG